MPVVPTYSQYKIDDLAKLNDIVKENQFQMNNKTIINASEQDLDKIELADLKSTTAPKETKLSNQGRDELLSTRLRKD